MYKVATLLLLLSIVVDVLSSCGPKACQFNMLSGGRCYYSCRYNECGQDTKVTRAQFMGAMLSREFECREEGNTDFSCFKSESLGDCSNFEWFCTQCWSMTKANWDHRLVVDIIARRKWPAWIGKGIIINKVWEVYFGLQQSLHMTSSGGCRGEQTIGENVHTMPSPDRGEKRRKRPLSFVLFIFQSLSTL